MNHKNSIQKYQITARAVSRAQQIILLYEGAIRFLNKAEIASSENNFQARYDNLDKVMQIINGLILSLNHDQNAKIAAALKKFYTDLYLQVMSLHSAHNSAVYKEVEDQLNIVLGAWREIEAQTNLNSSEISNKNYTI